MVVVCPQCKASQSVPQVQVGANGMVACSKCGHRFVAAGGAPKIEQDLANILGPELSGQLGAPTATGSKPAAPRPAPTGKPQAQAARKPQPTPPAVAPSSLPPLPVLPFEPGKPAAVPLTPVATPFDRRAEPDAVAASVHLHVSPWRLPPFPRAALTAAGAALAQYVRAVPTAPKLAAGGALVALVALVIVLAVVSGDTAFVGATRSMYSGPAESAFEIVDQVERGDRVDVLASDGDWILVRAPSQRIGYVAGEALVGSAPPVAPGWRFAGCRRRPLEADGADCQARARDQFHACRAFCDEPRCIEKCQHRFNECDIACMSPSRSAKVVGPVAEPEPALEAPTPAANEGRKAPRKPARKKRR